MTGTVSDLGCDYIQCRTHQVNMTTQQEVENHKLDNCNMHPMMFEYKYKKTRTMATKSKKAIQRLKDATGDKDYDAERMSYLKRYTIPTGHILLDGDFSKYKSIMEGNKNE